MLGTMELLPVIGKLVFPVANNSLLLAGHKSFFLVVLRFGVFDSSAASLAAASSVERMTPDMMT